MPDLLDDVLSTIDTKAAEKKAAEGKPAEAAPEKPAEEKPAEGTPAAPAEHIERPPTGKRIHEYGDAFKEAHGERPATED